MLTPNTSQTIAEGETLQMTATVSNDSSNAGVTWSLNPASGAGSLNPTTTSAATYDAPSSVSAPTNVTVTATSITYPNKTASMKITVEPPPTVTTTSVPDGAVNGAYSASVSESGGVGPFTWSLASGTLPPGLSLGSSTSDSVSISGTPNASGVFTFTVKVIDSTGASAVSQSLGITIAAANANDSLLTGNYAFEFSGFNSSGAVVMAGSFTADGKGNITNGLEDSDSIQGPPKNQTFTGTYTLGNDNRGVLSFATGSPSSVFATYAIAVDSSGAHARFIEFDQSGIRGSGDLEQQTLATCAYNTIDGQYVVGLTGWGKNFPGVFIGGPVDLAGSVSALAPASPGGQGTLGPGEIDANTPGFVSVSPLTLSGSYAATAQSARCTMSISAGGLPSVTLSIYPVSSTEAFVVETDNVKSTTPLVMAGSLTKQSGYPFTGLGGLNGVTAGAVVGQFLPNGASTYVPDVAVVSISATGSGGFTMSLVDNQGGSVQNFGSPISGTYTIDSYGRVLMNVGPPFSPVLYLIGQNSGVMVGTLQGDPTFAVFQPQSGGPFNASVLKGTFLGGTLSPSVDTVLDLSGSLSLDGVSAISGTEDDSTSSGSNSAQAVQGTYSITNSGSGSGTVVLTKPSDITGNFLAVSPTKVFVVTTTQGDSNPVVIVLGN
ncbi:MAG TPA: putative Ig domain-containing protein [Candidatus Acidoferrales bacterium]|nr:putative Ig domain-containing protein [Candidatus Acidoferrales bacterium]